MTYGLLLHRYADADHALERAISLAPDIPAYHALRASLYLMRYGDARRAKQILTDAASRFDVARVLANGLVTAQDRVRVRVFAAEYHDALARLTLQAAKGDSATYYLLRAEFYDTRKDIPTAHLYYDSARAVIEGRLRGGLASRASEELPLETQLALAYAGLGRKADAVRLGREGAQLLPVSRDAFAGTLVLQDLTEVYIRVGEHDAAVDQLDYLLSIPSPVSSGLLRVDPLYTPLRGNPRFERLVQQN